MKGPILDFLKLATEKPELAKELVELATKYDFEFSDEVSDEELEGVAGGTLDAVEESQEIMQGIMEGRNSALAAIRKMIEERNAMNDKLMDSAHL
ncbi:hypothetical protein ACFL3B_03720 [Gemmatimonadota bacterium]